jgi:hypothetical protein
VVEVPEEVVGSAELVDEGEDGGGGGQGAMGFHDEVGFPVAGFAFGVPPVVEIDGVGEIGVGGRNLRFPAIKYADVGGVDGFSQSGVLEDFLAVLFFGLGEDMAAGVDDGDGDAVLAEELEDGRRVADGFGEIVVEVEAFFEDAEFEGFEAVFLGKLGGLLEVHLRDAKGRKTPV